MQSHKKSTAVKQKREEEVAARALAGGARKYPTYYYWGQVSLTTGSHQLRGRLLYDLATGAHLVRQQYGVLCASVHFKSDMPSLAVQMGLDLVKRCLTNNLRKSKHISSICFVYTSCNQLLVTTLFLISVNMNWGLLVLLRSSPGELLSL